MRIAHPSTKIWGECPTNEEEAILWIERAGRVCYRSEDKIIEGSGRKFVDGIVSRKHFSVIEHSNFVLRTAFKPKFPNEMAAELSADFYSKFLNVIVDDGYVYIGGNFRAWMEHLHIGTITDLFRLYVSDPFYVIVTEHSEIPRALKMISASFLTDRAVTHELVRHRPASYSQESQRYCSYREHLEVILPDHYANADPVLEKHHDCYAMWMQAMNDAEKYYKALLHFGERPEQARSVLPNCTATRIVMTADIPEWEHVFSLRNHAAAYPGIRNRIAPAMIVFQANGWI